jgi:hypothetical protein
VEREILGEDLNKNIGLERKHIVVTLLKEYKKENGKL